MNNKQLKSKRKKSNNNQPNNQQSKRKKSNNNQKRPQNSRILRRTNTYVHTNKDNICYIYSTFTLINNILNNILVNNNNILSNILVNNNNNKKYNTINTNKYHNNYFLISFLIHTYYINYIPTLCNDINIIYFPNLLNNLFIDFIYDIINKRYDFKIGYDEINDIKIYSESVKREKKEILYEKFECYVEKYNEQHVLIVFKIIEELLDRYNQKLTDTSIDLSIYKTFLEEDEGDIKKYIDEFFNKITFLKDFKLYKIYNNFSIPIYKRAAFGEKNIVELCNNTKLNEYYINNEIINIYYNIHSIELENIIKHVLKNKQYVIIDIYYNEKDISKFNEYNKTHTGINILKFEKVTWLHNFDIHSIIFTDYDEELDIYRFKNNWGSDWGYNGYGYTTLKDMNIIDISFLADDEETYKLVKDFSKKTSESNFTKLGKPDLNYFSDDLDDLDDILN